MGRSSQGKPLVPFLPEEATPLELGSPTHANVLAMMAHSSDPDDEIRMIGEPVEEEDHSLTATLPMDRSVVNQSGRMDHHRKPIVSIHGKDVGEHELERWDAA